MTLTDVKKRALFKTLATKTQYETGVEFGLDKYYKNKNSVVAAVNRIFQAIKADPEKYAMTHEVVTMVQDSMISRTKLGGAARPTEVVNIEEYNEKELVLGGRKKAWVLLNRKMDYLLKNRRAFKNESIMSLAKVAGITFDKGQIATGEATEHIAMKAKIDRGMSSDEALAQLMKIREVQMKEEE